MFAEANPVRILQAIRIRLLERRIARVGVTTTLSGVPNAPSGVTTEQSGLTTAQLGVPNAPSGETAEPSGTSQPAAETTITVPPPSAALVSLAAEEGISMADLLSLPPDQLAELEALAAEAGL